MKMPMSLAYVFLAYVASLGGLWYPFYLSGFTVGHPGVRLHHFCHAISTSILLNLAFLQCHPVLGACPIWFGGCVPLTFFHMGNSSGHAIHAEETTYLTSILVGTAARVPIFLPHISRTIFRLILCLRVASRQSVGRNDWTSMWLTSPLCLCPSDEPHCSCRCSFELPGETWFPSSASLLGNT